MNILMTGSSGLIGTALRDHLDANGHGVVPLMRATLNIPELPHWVPDQGILHIPEDFDVEAIIHLAGAPLNHFPWTKKYKEELVLSRVQGTALLASALTEMDPMPKVLITASAIGYYGHREEEVVDEESAPGEGFLAETCVAWENACQAAIEAGIRVVNLRIGLVLSSEGGLLKSFLGPFRSGLGAVMGSGRQMNSWITMHDLVRAVRFVLEKDFRGPVNLVSPNAVPHKEFAKTLGRVLHRPVLFRIPGWMLRMAMGEAAREMILGGVAVEPAVLKKKHFTFHHPQLEDALESVLHPE